MQFLVRFASLAAVVTVASTAQVSLSFTGKTLNIGNVSYFIPPTAVSTFKLDTKAGSLVEYADKTFGEAALIPISVISTAADKFTDSDLTSTVAAYAAVDDVWSVAFLAGIFVTYNGTKQSASIALSSSQKTYGIDFILGCEAYYDGTAVTVNPPPGPYFLEPNTGNVFEAYRLYDDPQQSFDYGVMPDGDGGYQMLPAKIPGAATETIGVPSRLYFTPTPEKPLSGLRLAVKDIYDVKGLRTGCGNRAYYNLYPEKTASGPAVQRLIDGGMIIVGKAKTSQFANGETATDDWVDLHAPYNPRGDGYQDGSSSSTGPGTAMAAYDWLDHAIGSDTGGSMRGPSGANGVFGNRPSHGSLPTDDVMPLSPALDTLGIFSRDAKSWAAAGHYWYSNLTSYSKFPTKIMFPVDTWGSSFLTTPPANGTADATFNAFITKLEGFLNTTRTEFNMTSLWTETMPANTTAMKIMLNTTYPALIALDQTRLLAEPFFADYAAVSGGRMPFVDPAPSARWAYGYSLPNGTYDAAIANKTTFMNWFADEVVPYSPDSCSDAIFLYAQSSGGTNYRNRYVQPPAAPFGFSAGRYAVMAETPDMVVPVGEHQYNSTITGMTEYLPVTLSFVTRKDCDLMLFDLFAALQDAGIISPVNTGTRVF